MNFKDPYEIAKYIKQVEKKTPVKAYIRGKIGTEQEGVNVFPMGESTLVIGEYDRIKTILASLSPQEYHLEYDRRNSAIPLLDTNGLSARIEPGAIIREGVTIEPGAVIMMGAVLNIGAVVGEKSMIDMNAVVGARGTIGKNVHVGAGAVIAGVLEPPSKTPVEIEDEVLIGANAVVLEGVRVGTGAVVAAGSVVTEDVPPLAVVAGSPAKIIKYKDEQTKEKTKILEDLRD